MLRNVLKYIYYGWYGLSFNAVILEGKIKTDMDSDMQRFVNLWSHDQKYDDESLKKKRK